MTLSLGSAVKWTDLRTMIMWALLDTGLVLSTYAVTLASLYMICGSFDEMAFAGGEPGERAVAERNGLNAVVAMLHRGHPERGAYGFKICDILLA